MLDDVTVTRLSTEKTIRESGTEGSRRMKVDLTGTLGGQSC